MKRKQQVKFQRWWKYMNSDDLSRDRREMIKWLKYGSKTVSLRGDHNQQKLVYTIAHRHYHSKYRISRSNALKVFTIVNEKQDMYKRVKQQYTEEQVRRQPRQPVVVKTIRKRTIAHR